MNSGEASLLEALASAESAHKICHRLKSQGKLGCAIDEDPEKALQEAVRLLKKLVGNGK